MTLARAAWFAPGEPIPRALLRASAGVDASDEPAVLSFEDGLTRLRALGLISEQEQGALILHRLLAAFVRTQAGDAEIHRGQVEAAVVAEVKRLNEAGLPAPLLAWQPQLRFLVGQASEAWSLLAVPSLGNLRYHLRMIADFLGAKAAHERAVTLGEKTLGPEHPEVTINVNNLGLVLHDLGDLAGAKAALERALRIAETRLGRDHPSVGIRVNNLGGVLKELGDLAGARSAFERALPIFEKHLGPEHPNVATLVNNLGTVLQHQGDLAGAKAAYERALKIHEAPTTQTSGLTSIIWARCFETSAISRALKRPMSGHSESTKDASALTTPTLPETPITWAPF